MFKLLVFAFCPSFAAPVWADQVKVTLLGVGDVYNFAGGGKLSGFARLNAMAMAERVANPNIIPTALDIDRCPVSGHD